MCDFLSIALCQYSQFQCITSIVISKFRNVTGNHSLPDASMSFSIDLFLSINFYFGKGGEVFCWIVIIRSYSLMVVIFEQFQ
jgi:hypothetical protein